MKLAPVQVFSFKHLLTCNNKLVMYVRFYGLITLGIFQSLKCRIMYPNSIPTRYGAMRQYGFTYVREPESICLALQQQNYSHITWSTLFPGFSPTRRENLGTRLITCYSTVARGGAGGPVPPPPQFFPK